MKMRYIKILIALLSIGLFSCASQEGEKESTGSATEEIDFIFPKGRQGSSETFTGTAFNYPLVMDTALTTMVGNVYFEPGARSNWHSHPAGQILIITDGEGFHQIEGEPKQLLKKGDVAVCPPNKKHWHGASPDTGMQQIYMLPNTEKGIVTWMEAVTDAQYN
ncbi:cupin domain-containing protein [Roseivirga sp.]|uniref:cupin domain-containing protein n=1 Tax=Roseivirga sp. TaxID=1964215 RepID=UPI003B521337